MEAEILRCQVGRTVTASKLITEGYVSCRLEIK